MLAQAEELAHLGSWEYNIKTNKLLWSEELYKIFGVSEMEHTPSLDALEKILHPDYRDRILKNLKNFIAKGETLSQYEKIVRPDGEIRYLQTNAIKRKGENGEVNKIIGATLDITELREMEQELLYSQKQLRALTERLRSTREDERKFLAREIHDEFGQLLTALKMDVDLMIDDLENNNPKTELMIFNLRSIESLIKKAITSVQDIATMLRPDVLDHLDLVSALEWQLKEFENRFKIKTSLKKEVIEYKFDDKIRLALFRIFQEGLTNVARHSNATEVKVDLFINNSIFEMKTIDNGIGISQDNLDSLNSIGLIGMRERIILLDGKIDIKNYETGGVELHLKMPMYKDSYESNISR
jgi:two-component system sensor histidine kinase UhpB